MTFFVNNKIILNYKIKVNIIQFLLTLKISNLMIFPRAEWNTYTGHMWPVGRRLYMPED